MHLLVFIMIIIACSFAIILPVLCRFAREKNKTKLEITIAIWYSIVLILFALIIISFETYKTRPSVKLTFVHYESGSTFSTHGLETVIDNEHPSHIEEITYKWGFLYRKEKTLHLNLSN